MIIYKITNKINGKIYIGKTERLLIDRWQSHCYSTKIGSKSYFHQSIRKNGISNFSMQIIDKAVNNQKLNELEKYYILKFNSTNPKIGYNGTFGGDGGKPTKESCLKISKTLSGRKKPRTSDEIRKKISIANSGKTHSKETREKISKIHLGKVVLEETKQKLKEAWKTRSPITEETKQKISRALKGRKFTEEWKDKIRQASKKHKHNEQSKQKMSEARRGKIPWNKGLKNCQKISEETKKKMSEGQKRRWQNKKINENKSKY